MNAVRPLFTLHGTVMVDAEVVRKRLSCLRFFAVPIGENESGRLQNDKFGQPLGAFNLAMVDGLGD